MEKMKIQDEFRQKKISRDKNEDGGHYFSVITSLGQHLLCETHFSVVTVEYTVLQSKDVALPFWR